MGFTFQIEIRMINNRSKGTMRYLKQKRFKLLNVLGMLNGELFIEGEQSSANL